MSCFVLIICVFFLTPYGENYLLFESDLKSKRAIIGKLIYKKNDSRLKKSKDYVWKQNEENYEIMEGDSLFAGENSSNKILLGNNQEIVMESNSLIKFENINNEPVVRLEFGNFKIKPTSKIKFLINKKIVQFTDKSKDLQIRINPEKKSEVQILEDNKLVKLEKIQTEELKELLPEIVPETTREIELTQLPYEDIEPVNKMVQERSPTNTETDSKLFEPVTKETLPLIAAPKRTDDEPETIPVFKKSSSVRADIGFHFDRIDSTDISTSDTGTFLSKLNYELSVTWTRNFTNGWQTNLFLSSYQFSFTTDQSSTKTISNTSGSSLSFGADLMKIFNKFSLGFGLIKDQKIFPRATSVSKINLDLVDNYDLFLKLNKPLYNYKNLNFYAEFFFSYLLAGTAASYNTKPGTGTKVALQTIYDKGPNTFGAEISFKTFSQNSDYIKLTNQNLGTTIYWQKSF